MTPEQIARYEAFPRPTIPGPWRWCGHIGGAIDLRTTHSGQLIVMGCKRAGMREAQPTFQVIDPEHSTGPVSSWWGMMHRADNLAVREAEYRTDIASIDNPEATLIAAAPEIREAIDVLLAEVANWREIAWSLLLQVNGEWGIKDLGDKDEELAREYAYLLSHRSRGDA